VPRQRIIRVQLDHRVEGGDGVVVLAAGGVAQPPAVVGAGVRQVDLGGPLVVGQGEAVVLLA
jgi:hypothetical protein